MTRYADALTAAWQDGQDIVPGEEMYDVTVRVAATTLFGTRVTDAEVAEIRQAIGAVLAGGFRRMVTPVALAGLPTPANRRYVQAKHTLFAAVRRTVDQRRHSDDDGSILATFLATQNEAGALSETEVYDQVLSLLVAGVDTTACALGWACLLLSRHPEIQERLHREARAVLGGRAATWEDLPRLEMAERVLTESLRLRPPVWLLSRTVTRDALLAGHRVPAGATVLIGQHILHQRADLFARPEDFDPDRWLASTTPRNPRDGFIPFSSGARQCIGNDFAIAEATLVLATVADRWRLEDRDPNGSFRPVPRIVLAPPKKPLRIHRRPDSTDSAG